MGTIVSMLVSFLLLTQVAGTQVTSLSDYLNLDTGKVSWSTGPISRDFSELRLNGLTWQGDVWRHEIIVAGSSLKSDVAILNLTGDRMGSTMDDFTVLFSKTCHLPVATVYGIPNQPSFGLREDDLVGYGIRQFFMTKDNTWPLLLPMTKSAILAMNAIQEWSKGKIKKFIVTGTSKRGATSWLVASTGDPRVIGIVPMVADMMIDMTRQLTYQKEVWGQYTPMIPDFKTMDPVPIFNSPRGKEMMGLIDPYQSMPRVTVPVLVVSGCNDQVTVVDSAKFYWDRIKAPKLFKAIPNASHFFAIPNALHEGYSKELALDSMRAIRFFADCITGVDRAGLPDISNTKDPRRSATQIWSVSGDAPWLNDTAWKQGAAPANAKWSATLTQVEFKGSGYSASFTSPITMRGPKN